MRNPTGAYRHVVVVGGTSAIATAILHELIATGTQVVTLLARNTEAAEAIPLATSVDRRVIAFDAIEPATHAAIARQVADAGPDVDLVLVTSGMLGNSKEASHDPEYAAQIINTTFTGTATMMGALADVLTAQGHGTIVVMSSVAGVRVRGDNHVYGAAKAGLDGFAQGLRQRVDGTGVEILIARPGFVRTRMSAGIQAAPFAIDADQVADDVCRALAKGTKVVWSPKVLRFVMTVVQALPASVFQRLSARAGRPE